MSSNTMYSFNTLKNFISDNFSLLVIAIIIYGAGFFTGSLWTENSMLKNGGVTTAGTTTTAPTDTTADAGPTKEQLSAIPDVDSKDHVRGNINAKVVLVEYSDYECPFCARFHPTITQLKEEFGDDVAWVYRHFPLSIHPNAQKAAEAAECVAKQGGNDAFWAYSDYVFEQNTTGTISPQIIQDGAQTAGVNMESFNTCLESGEMADLVETSLNAGSAGGVSATPGTVVVTADGPQEIILGAYPIDQVRATIQKYL